MFLPSYYQPDCKIRWGTVSLLDQLIVSIEGLTETLIYVSSKQFRIDEVVKRGNTALQKVHLGTWYHVHRDLVEINVQIPFKPHTAGEVVHYIGHDRVFLFEIICLFFCIAGLEKGAAFFHGLLLFFLLHFRILIVNTTDDVEKGLVVDWKDAVCVFNKLVKS